MSSGGVSDLVPFVHVADVARSAAFYRELGFEVLDRYDLDGVLEWAWLEASNGRLMLGRATAPIRAEEQAVLFWVYTQDIDSLRRHLVDVGIDAGPVVVDQDVGPRRQMRVDDLDGYCVMVGEIAAARVTAGH